METRIRVDCRLDSDPILEGVDVGEQSSGTDAWALEQGILDQPEEPITLWPYTEPGGAISEHDYLQRCHWRLGNVGHALDVVRDIIQTESDATAWLELKMAILAAKSITDPGTMIETVLLIEEAGREFVTRVGIDWQEFDRVSNP